MEEEKVVFFFTFFFFNAIQTLPLLLLQPKGSTADCASFYDLPTPCRLLLLGFVHPRHYPLV